MVSGQVILREARPEDREEIYRARYDVYSTELGQHPESEDGLLKNELDSFNRYFVAIVDDQLAGFISLTPPGGGSYSLDSYISRDQWPFDITPALYEVRLLTVIEANRGSLLATALMYAALRAVEASGGDRMMVIGRTDLTSMYQGVGFEKHDIELVRGKVSFQLMSASVEDVRRRADNWRGLIPRLDRELDWQMPVSFRKPAACFHGGGFFKDVGDDFQALSRHGDIINADVLDAWFPPAPAVLSTIRDHLDWLIRTSPPTGCEGLIETISRVRGVPISNILTGAGSSDLIFLAFQQWLTRESRVLLLDPTYGEYTHVCQQVIGCHVEQFLLEREKGFQIDAEALRERILEGDFDLVVVVNPNSPTGRHLPADDLKSIIATAAGKTRFWIDETYIEYVQEQPTLEKFACSQPHVVVCKSMSKVYALSGVRSAYLCAAAELLESLRALTPPWAISLPGQVAAVKALEDPQYYRQQYAATAAAREVLLEDLRELGLEVIPGVANFLLAFLPPDGPSAAQVTEQCRHHGVHLRDASNMGSGLGSHAIRIAVKSTEQNATIVETLAMVLQRTPA